MKNSIVKLVKGLIVIILLMRTAQVSAQNYQDTLNMKLSEFVKKSKIPGFGVAIVSKDQILYSNGFGFANKEKKIAYTTYTVQNIGSISKTFIALTLMRMIEKGKISLNDKINKYLPFKIKNPKHPNAMITIRQLATHTSSLTDGPANIHIEKCYLFNGLLDFKNDQLPKDYVHYFKIYRNNKAFSLELFLKNAYHPNGEWYSNDNFLDAAPGTTYHYSNLGATLLAYILELVAERPYSELTRELILSPLNMTSSFWFLEDIPKEKLASVYLSNGLHIPNYDSNSYPDGSLYTSISDFSLYLIEMIKGINGQSNLMTKASFKEMMSNQLIKENFPMAEFKNSKGLFWSVNRDGDNIGANGADPGVSSYTIITTKGNVALVIFQNMSIDGNEELEQEILTIRNILFQYTGKLIKQ